MKKTIIILGALLSTNLMADSHFSKGDLIKQALSLSYEDKDDQENIEKAASIEKSWNEIFDHQNLKNDLNKHRIDWRSSFPISRNHTHEISGSRIYYKIFKKDYRYTVKESLVENKLIVELKIHFYPSKAYLKMAEKLHQKNDPLKDLFPRTEVELLKRVAKELKKAEKLWNLDAPENVRFNFIMTSDKEEAHYSIRLSNNMNAQYDKFIFALGSHEMIAHEVGHMLGLDEEYTFVTSNILTLNQYVEFLNPNKTELTEERSVLKDRRCHLKSLMCYNEKIYPYHYDHILSRIN